jgi:hypothetical protein
MNEQNKQAIDELREFMKSENWHESEEKQRSENSLTWKDIALGIYVGGMAIAATSMIMWVIFAGLLIATVK